MEGADLALNQELVDKFRKNYDRIAADDLALSIQPAYLLDAQAEKLFSYLPKRAGLSICEIGVGQGRLMRKLVTLAPKKLVGVDIAADYLNRLVDEHVPFTPIQANAETLPFVDEFDLIVSADVLEHVMNVGDFLHSVHKGLKSKGIFVVHVPYLEDYTAYSKQRGCKYDFVHLRNFSRTTLKIILEGAGFKVLKFKYDGFVPYRMRYCNHFRLRNASPILTYPGRKIAQYLLPRVYAMKRLASIPNWLGCLFIRPFGIAAICQKQ